MDNIRMMQIAREYLNASGKIPDWDDLQSLPGAFDRHREYDAAADRLRSRKLGRNEEQFRSYLSDVRQWTIQARRQVPGQALLFED